MLQIYNSEVISDIFCGISNGLSPDNIRFKRSMKITIYTKMRNDGMLTTNNIKKFINYLGFEIIEDKKAIINSFLKRITALSKDPMVKKELDDVYEKGKKALELNYIDEKQANIDLVLAKSAREIIEAVKDQEYCACQLGSLLVMKNNGKIVIKTLTIKQLEALELNPNLLTDSINVLNLLK